MIFHPDSIWNKPIGASPVIVPNAYVSRMDRLHTAGVTVGGSTPVYAADSSTPRVQVYNRGGVSELVPMPVGALPDPESDGKIVILERGAGIAWSFYQWVAYLLQPDGTYQTPYWLGWGNIASNGNGIDSFWGGQVSIGGGGRAAGWNYISGLVMLDEVMSGRIDHALHISVNVNLLYREGPYGGHIWPAKASDGRSADPAALRMGMRFQLDPNLNLDSLMWGGRPMTPAAKVIARAFQEYGAWIGDTGGVNAIHCQEFIRPDGTLDPSPWLAIGIDWNSLKALPIWTARIIEAKPSMFFTGIEFPPPPPEPQPEPEPEPQPEPEPAPSLESIVRVFLLALSAATLVALAAMDKLEPSP